MEKKAESTISELNRKIESLQAKRDAVIRKEKERKAKAQEKWRQQFMKVFIPHVSGVFGEDYEEDILPERLSDALGDVLGQIKEDTEDERSRRCLSDRDDLGGGGRSNGKTDL